MLRALAQPVQEPLPSSAVLADCRSKIITSLPDEGLGLDTTSHHLQELASGFSGSSRASTYYGFVTGGATPAAKYADHLVVEHDQNVQVHLPNETIATDIEDRALRMLLQLLKLQPSVWPHRTFTTGATASNVIGLACGRQFVLEQHAKQTGSDITSVAEYGIFEVMKAAKLDKLQILTTAAHSSLRKAASILGLGRAAVVDCSLKDEQHAFDLAKLEDSLRQQDTASVVAISCAEVNTGLFATSGEDMHRIRKLCDQYKAWIHVDGAFGLLARALPERPEYKDLLAGVEGLELADSIAGDAHKLVNVPYDCGFFFSRSLDIAVDVFQNPNAAYLSSASSAGIPSPLNVGIENSRRFRALPIYATLIAYGRQGYSNMIERQVTMARAIAGIILDSPAYELLPQCTQKISDNFDQVYIVVLFRAVDPKLNKSLVQYINATRRVYVSGTSWDGSPAARFAVANYQADVNSDLLVVKEVLEAVLNQKT